MGAADTYGVELKAYFSPTEWLTGAFSLGWLDPKFDNAVANPGLPTQQDLSGKLIPCTRKWTASLHLSVDQPVSDPLDFIATAAVRYEQGGILGDHYVVDPYDTMTKVDLSAGVAIDDRTRITAYVRNAG